MSALWIIVLQQPKAVSIMDDRLLPGTLTGTWTRAFRAVVAMTTAYNVVVLATRLECLLFLTAVLC
ncbi:hypothetical protein KP79_PYT21839 [Mizuhopecten yessoensis]|uniref:Uncharacterized protein n=1 Tax=Mizuhopecten yessoensis TaxID=6573 RepID=A0A210QY41_MIZYE|nr:hypothetical protein KP79_PYT21839 [Mizuhopecten yessoensis]